MKDIIVFYHKDCPDGFGAAWAAWKNLRNKADYIGIAPAPDGKLLRSIKNRTLYFLDAAPESKGLIEDVRRANQKVVLIDHHVSRTPTIGLYSDSLFSLDQSGAVLSWIYFHGKKAVPWLLRYVEDYDLWQFRLPFSRELHAMIDMTDFNFASWSRLAKNFENKARRRQYAAQGEGITRYLSRRIKDLSREAEWVNFEGYKVLALNSSVLKNEIGDYLVRYCKSPFAIIWRYQEGNLRVSLRSEGKINVAVIAEKYGSGGHQAAASFLRDIKKGFPWKPVKDRVARSK